MSKIGYREKCLAQKINVCNECGTSENLVVHHLNGDREDNRLENLVPVCRSCHTSIHGGGVPRLSERLPPESRTDRPEGRTGSMRPNIRITHYTSGRVKDLASINDMTTSEAYEEIIVTGLAELEGDDE